MKILKVLWEHEDDFCADMVCEHCGHVDRLTNGYFAPAIPTTHCKGCGKNRAGEAEHTDSKVMPCVR